VGQQLLCQFCYFTRSWQAGEDYTGFGSIFKLDGLATAGGGVFFGAARGAVPDQDVEASVAQVAGHRVAHGPEAEEGDFGLHA